MLCLYRSIARHGMPGWICRGHLSFPLIPSLYHATATVLEPVESPREGLLRPGPVGCSGCRYPGRQGRAGGPDDDWSSFTFPFSSFPHFPFLRLVVKCDLFFSPSPGLRLSLSLIYPSLSFPPHTHQSHLVQHPSANSNYTLKNTPPLPNPTKRRSLLPHFENLPELSLPSRPIYTAW